MVQIIVEHGLFLIPTSNFIDLVQEIQGIILLQLSRLLPRFLKRPHVETLIKWIDGLLHNMQVLSLHRLLLLGRYHIRVRLDLHPRHEIRGDILLMIYRKHGRLPIQLHRLPLLVPSLQISQRHGIDDIHNIIVSDGFGSLVLLSGLLPRGRLGVSLDPGWGVLIEGFHELLLVHFLRRLLSDLHLQFVDLFLASEFLLHELVGLTFDDEHFLPEVLLLGVKGLFELVDVAVHFFLEDALDLVHDFGF